MENFQYINLDDIWIDEDFNARDHITPASVAGLAESIRAEGLYQNPVVQKYFNKEKGTHFKVVMGHRRIVAWGLNKRLYPAEAPKWDTINCKVVEPLLDSEARIMNLKENMERKNLNMLEEAKSVAVFKKDGVPMLKVAKDLGVSKKWVEIRYGLLGLPEEIQRRAAANFLTQYQVEECIKKSTREEQINYVRMLVDHKIRGEKLSKEGPPKKLPKPKAVLAMAKGTPRSCAELAAVQESIQDSFDDVQHPAAMALGFAMGAISYEEFIDNHVLKWADESGHKFEHHETFKDKE